MSRTVPKRIIIFAPYPKGTAPSQRFRFEQYLPLLEQEGYEIVYKSFLSEKTWDVLYKDGGVFQKIFGVLGSFLRRWIDIFKIKKTDLVFVHREMSHIGPPIFEWITAKVLRRKYIYDFDDAIWLPNYSESNARFHRLKAYWKVNYCMKWADKISAGNAYLANYAKKFNPNIFVVPTTIDMENHHNLSVDYEKKPIVIGWTGTHTTMHYLDEIVPVMQELENEFDFIFRVISNEKPEYNLKSLEYLPWKKETEIEDLASFQIGIMPLEDDKWAKGKCGFKALQYMSLGIPTLLSPVGVNTEIVSDKISGYFCSSKEDWKANLRLLLSDDSLRKEMGQAGREVISQRYSVQANIDKYKELLG